MRQNRLPDIAAVGRAAADTMGITLLLLMLFLPNVYQPVKAALLAGVLFAVAIKSIHRGVVPIDTAVALWALAEAATGLFFMLVGLFNGAPGAFRVGTVYAVWPLVYLILLAFCARYAAIRTLAHVMVCATILISLYGLSFVAHALGYIPDALYLRLPQGQVTGFYNGRLALYSLSSLLFLIPFCIAALVVRRRGSPGAATPLSLWIAIGLSLPLAVLSGRRALLLVTALAPVITILFRQVLPTAERVRTRWALITFIFWLPIILLGLAITLHSTYSVDFSAVGDAFRAGFDFNHDVSAVARRDQFYALIQGWIASPIIGSGHGATAAGSLRSAEMPWAYELSYLALLYHTGIVGFAIYSAGVIWMYAQAFQILRRGTAVGVYLLPFLVGTSCFLVASATNPYLEKFDYLWVIFVPLAVVNWCRVDPMSSPAANQIGRASRR